MRAPTVGGMYRKRSEKRGENLELIKFTDEQKSKLLRCFGGSFVEALPSRLEYYAKLWKLSDFSLIEYYSWYCLFICHSKKHGDCVLKVCGGGKDVYINEIRFFAEVKENRRYVKAYEVDEECGALLLQRVIPGTTLKAEPSLDKRISAFIDVWKKAHIVPHNATLFETYLETIQRAAKASWKHGDIPVLRKAAEKMVAVCRELYEKYPERLLLHSDLHGDNLLKNSQEEYIIVDPHGRIGPLVCDLGRYIANEHFDAEKDKRDEVAEYTIEKLSKELNLPQIDVARSFFADITLMACWGAEDGEVNCDNVETYEGLLQEEC